MSRRRRNRRRATAAALKTARCQFGRLHAQSRARFHRAVGIWNVGGSVALADPAADWPSCLIALGATVRIASGNTTRTQPVADFVQGSYSTTLAAGEIILGFDVPRPDAPLRWGFAKVVRKSGAFANSIALVVTRGKGGPVSVVLAAAGTHPFVFTGTARQIADGMDSEDALRTAIADDLKAHLPNADAYEGRLHTSTVIRAAKEMRAQE
jgi:carbon-monoxide dehydrogenase medium subunit